MIDSYLRMYTVQEVSDLFKCLPADVEMLSAVGCLKSIQIGDKRLYSFEAIKRFQSEYCGLDVSNQIKARNALRTVARRSRYDE